MGQSISTMVTRMKILIVPWLACCMQLSGQYETGIHKLLYTNSQGEKGFTTYIYNGRETPCKAIWELADGSRWSVNHHTFDERGHLVERSREFSDSVTSRQRFTYNQAGRLVHETFSRSDGVVGEVEYRYTGDRCIKAICNGLNGWFFGEIIYHLNEEGERDSASLVMKGNRVGFIRYRLDETGRIDHEVWTFSSGFTQSFTYNYLEKGCTAYRSSNALLRTTCSKVVRQEQYDYNGQGGGPSYYEYDSQNRLLKKTFVRSDGLKTVTGYTYLDNGLLKESVRQYNDGKTGTFTYTYDRYRQLTRRDFLRSDGFTGSETYTYDRNGKMITARYVNFDGWLTGDLAFSHDRYDRIISASFTGENGISAGISFRYDEPGNLARIHWEFGNGTTQTYLFSYD